MLESRPKAVLAFLSIINLVNYCDRGVIPGAPIQFGSFVSCTLGVAASQQSVYVGLSVSAFVVCYAIASPICGQLVLSQPAFRILGIGLSIWVAALLLSGLAYFAGDAPGAFLLFLAGRALSGVGEAAFQCIVPPYVEDFAPAAYKGLCLALFYTAIPVGTAIGYEFGALLAEGPGWGWAFLLEAAAMAPFAALAFRLPPASALSARPAAAASLLAAAAPLQQQEEPPTPSPHEAVAALSARPDGAVGAPGGSCAPGGPREAAVTLWAQLSLLLSSPSYVCLVLGYAAETATVIGISTYGPVFLLGFGSFHSQAACSLAFAGAVSVGGVLGTPLGGVLTDTVLSRAKRAGTPHSAQHAAAREAALVSGVICLLMLCGLLCMAAAAAVAATPELVTLFLVLMSLAVFFIYGTSAGLSRVIMLTVPMQTRPFALALQTLGLHLFGDVPSPVIIGAVKDSLAPHCGIVFGNDTASGCGGERPPRDRPETAQRPPRESRGVAEVWPRCGRLAAAHTRAASGRRPPRRSSAPSA
ncbi:hypothetical protein EMIHUDRAFT_456983 [Emiliania huxleyi CCMP1516]|uniref:Major facilitator superfamily (MFS) profile domain-containing protein n=2 Tax=Emiliania huxleyi TaxID=2903 RepID=A0A0D3JXG4_EMIH1|nr:hypothetical protein EMIHUDRAFT_456983 [Emiliania huxleyi CCMP1516]EOD28199.1 hypothetical protein EMIHUDRAFT_456983 [Emiliania huxleyi CCMP1516]|eukprot:XP_005780628.1 hypothetical protein EMIHUDRAFT_456983 [Emiliania huxleyi CCMP1516]